MDVSSKSTSRTAHKDLSYQEDASGIPSQVPKITDANLGQLRQTIKNAMIPLLIKVFELKLAAQQAKMPPSRLNKKNFPSLEDIQEQLTVISKNLDLLHLWCESSKLQITKAFREIEELTKNIANPRMTTSSLYKAPHPGIEKSFSEALAHKALAPDHHSQFKVHTLQEIEKKSCMCCQKKGWLRRFMQWVTESSP